VAELHSMFLDFALLTEQQGVLLDKIETQVMCASEYVDEGNKDVRDAIESLKAIRQRQCCIALIVVIVLAVIAAIIALKVQGNM